ncbi:MAG: hypothetical protein A2W93_13860 [Bacteroidetes bacterium GWF2_43_63]|nr:MAG: hypothetical protein A2W94_04055 [Bacteroidetes bacterium GWE2_42_42]OFY55072.1 MAG: hypothetical protein A2W93_13860 [Bacteroidetes bacterium GWF2_43_63]HBG69609.1 hypothetical protein [Bacteroidales bacterium]HCB60652.1 hypothetical protein [Bacteroidales bacterium]HCY24044.1 hypothetical protein [Bacteroidales bacterium]
MLTTILLVILGLYLFSQVMVRWVMPWLLHRYIRRMQERMNPDSGQETTRKEGTDVHIPRKQKSKSNRTYSNAEYVDYEDVDDGK